ncbi:hypothetical protein RF11_10718 [Thelohanellus kitauei]|uniref:Uncharacterized protein n=1 Tax=Thelohanellus kitauei TaxID=669202 RepID=A0A0C2IPV6_THEKT|nr:hypothetical protein RF11_10718 [Thelohanellus kitauei]
MNKAKVFHKIKELELSTTTARDRTAKICKDNTHHQVEVLKFVSGLPKAQISFYVRFISSTGPEEEPLGLIILADQTCAENSTNDGENYDRCDKWICCHFQRKN